MNGDYDLPGEEPFFDEIVRFWMGGRRSSHPTHAPHPRPLSQSPPKNPQIKNSISNFLEL